VTVFRVRFRTVKDAAGVCDCSERCRRCVCVTVFRVRFRTKVKCVEEYTHTREHTLRTTRIHVNTHTHTHTHTHMHTHTHTHTCNCTHTFTNLKTRKDTHNANTFMSKKVIVPTWAHRENAPFYFRSLLAGFL